MTIPRCTWFLLLVFLFFTYALTGQLDSGLKALANKSFAQAESILNSQSKKKKTAPVGHFGLVKLYSNLEAPQFDLKKAYANTKSFSESIRELKRKDKDELKAIGVSSKIIRALKDSIAIQAIAITSKENDPKQWEALIKDFGLTQKYKNLAKEKYGQSVLGQLDTLATALEVSDRLEQYEKLLSRYHPISLEQGKRYVLDKFIENHSWADFELFTKKFPENPFAKDQTAFSFIEIVGTSNLDDFSNFYNNFKYNPFAALALDSIEYLNTYFVEDLKAINVALDTVKQYALLADLAQTYQDQLPQRMFAETKTKLEEALFTSFIEENDWESLSSFQEIHPNNRFSLDKGAQAYSDIVNSESLDAFIAFKKNYPKSYFIVFANDEITRLSDIRNDLEGKARRAITQLEDQDALYSFHENYRSDYEQYAPRMNYALDRKILDYFVKEKGLKSFEAFQVLYPNNRFALDSAALDFVTIGGSQNLETFESFLKKYPKSAFRALTLDSIKHWTNYRTQLKKDVTIALRGKATFDELAEVYEQFEDRVQGYAPAIQEQLETKMIQAFLKEKDFKEINAFQSEYPNNLVLKEEELRMLQGLAGTGDLQGFRNFKYQYTNSPFIPLVRDSITTLNEKKRYEEYGFKRIQSAIRSMVLKKDWAGAIAKVEEIGKSSKKNDKYQYRKLLATLEKEDTGIERKAFSSEINSGGSVYTVSLTGDERQLYFCGKEFVKNVGGEDVFTSRKVGDKWMPPRVIAELSTKSQNEAPLSVSSDGNTLILFISGKLGYSKKTKDGWSKPQLYPNEINGNFWQCDAMITADGQSMLFTTYVDGYNMDLHISYKEENGSWSKAIPLSPIINTNGNERMPFLHADMRTLYFSSTSHGSIGEMDVFVSTRIGDGWDKWTEPINLGKEINTAGDDWGYKVTTDGSKAYFSMTQNGRYQLQEIDIPQPLRPGQVTTIEGKLKGLSINESVNLKIVNKKTGEVIGEVTTEPLTGKYFAVIPAGIDAEIKVNKKGVYTPPGRMKTLGTEKELPTEEEIIAARGIEETKDSTKVKRIQNDINAFDLTKEGDKKMTLTFNDVLFDTDEFEIRSEMRVELDELALAFKNTERKLSIHGHTDDVGTAVYNESLSQKRADAVKAYLIAQGCKKEHIEAIGFGEAKPISSNETEEGRAQNRRVEFIFE